MPQTAFLFSMLLAASPAPEACSAANPVDAAFCFLARQMDQYHQSSIVYSEPEQMLYFPSGWMGGPIEVDAMEKHRPHSGRACLRITYDPGKKPVKGWAGLYFQHPEGNWGERAGRDLTGATRLTFWARSEPPAAAEFKTGGLNRWPYHDAGKPYQDSFGPLSSGVAELGTEWRQYSIDLRSSSLSSVIGAFVWVSNIDQGLGRRSYFIDDITIDLPRLGDLRFLESYVPLRFDDAEKPLNTAHVYDQALVCLAFLARGRSDDLRRAALIADALVAVQEKDRIFKDGRLRNAYSSGELIDPDSGRPRLPGRWDPQKRKFLEDQYAAGSDTGNLAWAGLALIQAHRLLPRRTGDPYLQAALKIGRWIVESQKAEDARQGFFGGVEVFDPKSKQPEGQISRRYRSTEHNIDLVAFFHHLADARGSDTEDGRFWRAQERHAFAFVIGMWGQTAGGRHLWTGTQPDGTEVNPEVVPLDVQAWPVLALPSCLFEPALDWACRTAGAARPAVSTSIAWTAMARGGRAPRRWRSHCAGWGGSRRRSPSWRDSEQHRSGKARPRVLCLRPRRMG